MKILKMIDFLKLTLLLIVKPKSKDQKVVSQYLKVNHKFMVLHIVDIQLVQQIVEQGVTCHFICFVYTDELITFPSIKISLLCK